jgi:hypothetical protein
MQMCGWRGPYWKHINTCVPFFLFYFPYFCKNSKLMMSHCSLCVCVSSPNDFWKAESVFMKLVRISWHFTTVYYKSLSSVIPTMKLFRFLSYSLNIILILNILWTPAPIFMKLYKYSMAYEAISKVYTINQQWVIPTLQPPKLYCFVGIMIDTC